MSVRRKTTNRLTLYRTCHACGLVFPTTADNPFMRQMYNVDGKKQKTCYFCCEACWRSSYKHKGYWDGLTDARRKAREAARDVREKNRRYTTPPTPKNCDRGRVSVTGATRKRRERITGIRGRNGGCRVPNEYFCSWSGGADSTATALIAMERNEPMTALVYCEVMFNETISGEVPEHAKFISETAIPYFEKNGIKVIRLKSEKTFCDYFYWPITKGKNKGKLHGFPMSRKCSVKRDCKLPPLNKFIKEHKDSTWYLGIAYDEERRIKKMPNNAISLLNNYKITQKGAREICKKHGLLSPIYEFTKRGGCFFCPNACDQELKHLREYHPKLWNKLLEMQADQRVVRKNSFRFDLNLNELEYNFWIDDQQITFEDLGI